MNDKEMTHFMIDIETLGTRSNAVILSIGVALFDMKGTVEAVFHRRIDIQSCLDAGLQVDGDTIEWWFKQEDKNIKKLVSMNTKRLKDVLEELTRLAMGINSWYVWSHGSNFDLVLLENAYKAVGGKAWWKYSNVRDTRTLFDAANYKYTAKGGHDALEDAMNQAKAVAEAYQQLMGEK